jgi:hypothetical protein
MLRQEQGAEGTELPGAQELSPETAIDRWGDLLHDEEESYAPVQADEEPPTPAAAEPEPEPEVEEEEKASEPPAAKSQEQQQAPAWTPEQIAEAEKKFDEQLISHFSVSEEDALALQTEPEKVLPKMAARLYKETVAAVMQQVHLQIPAMLESYTQASTREMQAQQEFFTAWPELREHSQQVLQIGMMYRQVNPNASPQEAIQRIGEMAMVALGLKRNPPVEAPPVMKQSGFKPAGTGRVATPPPEPNKWQMVMADEDE